MSETRMLEIVQEALNARGIDDKVVAVGQFFPRGQTGGAFMGGMAGIELGGIAGGIGEAVGDIAGSQAGKRAANAASGLPARMLVGVSSTMVYRFAATTRHTTPTGLAFQLPREGLTVKVHQRVNVRVLELTEDASGARVQLEGNRLPVTHSNDVIQALSG